MRSMRLQVAYNPYIHGTNSAILAFFPQTHFKLLPPLDLAKEFQLAPLGGEINKGGLEIVDAKGHVCFARLQPHFYYRTPSPYSATYHYTRSNYPLERIIASYARLPAQADQDQENLIKKIKEEIQNGRDTAFANINVLLIYIARAKELGLENESFDPQCELKKHIASVFQYHAFLLCLGKYLHSDAMWLREQDDEMQIKIERAISQHLNFKSVLERIEKSGIDIQAMHEGSAFSPRDLQNLENLLQLPAEVTVKKLFSTELPEKLATEYEGYAPTLVGRSLINDPTGEFGLSSFLFRWRSANFSKNFFDQMHKQVNQLRLAFQERVNALIMLLEKNPTNLLQSGDSDFIKNPFPLILINEQEENNNVYYLDSGLMSNNKGEYRFKNRLELGKDITKIATDSLEHKQQVEDYLRKHNLASVSVILFEQLDNCRKTGEAPEALQDKSQEDIKRICDENTPEGLFGLFKKTYLQSYQSQFFKIHLAQ